MKRSNYGLMISALVFGGLALAAPSAAAQEPPRWGQLCEGFPNGYEVNGYSDDGVTPMRLQCGPTNMGSMVWKNAGKWK